MTMVTVPQGIDLGRMRCVHEIYLNVLHGIITFEEGTGRLEEVMSHEKRYCDSLCVLMCESTSHILWRKILDAKLKMCRRLRVCLRRPVRLSRPVD